MLLQNAIGSTGEGKSRKILHFLLSSRSFGFLWIAEYLPRIRETKLPFRKDSVLPDQAQPNVSGLNSEELSSDIFVQVNTVAYSPFIRYVLSEGVWQSFVDWSDG